ncbi:MAG: TonB-dependent receptor plug domain-containing protein [Cytophagales bacterium]|nr:TonB-dependent receptor plug domain-containing protein [Cytophagales bacterium]
MQKIWFLIFGRIRIDGGVLLLLFFLGVCFRASGQSSCDDEVLLKAKSDYNVGMFGESIQGLRACTDVQGFSLGQLKEAYHLLVLNYIALDNSEASQYYMEQLLRLEPDFVPGLSDPQALWMLAEQIKYGLSEDYSITIAGNEDKRKRLPYTVHIVDAKTIQRRGYNTFAEVLKDLPGFSFSSDFGSQHVNAYHRGNNNTDFNNFLLLIDGIEQNSVWSGGIRMYGQYPLSNVAKIEVIYGSSYSLFGQQAQQGVINIVTKALGEGEKVSVSSQVAYGHNQTYLADVSVVRRTKDFEGSLVFRYYGSGLNSLSSFEEFNYSPTVYSSYNYLNKLSLTGIEAREFAAQNTDIINNVNLRVLKDGNLVVRVEPTQIGIQNARNRDQQAFDTLINGKPIGYSNHVGNYYIGGRFKVVNLELGYNIWLTEVGNVNDGTRFSLGGKNNLGLWRPLQSNYYVHYHKDYSGKLTLHNISTFSISKIRRESAYTQFVSYANGKLGLRDLATNVLSGWESVYYYELSREFHNNTHFDFKLFNQLDVILGLNIRSGLVKGDFHKGTTPSASVQGSGSGQQNLQYVNYQNYSPYMHMSLALGSVTNLILNTRYDHTRLQDRKGFDDRLNYQAGLVFSPDPFRLKFTFGTLYQPPSMKQLFSTDFARDSSNVSLNPEEGHIFDLNVVYRPSTASRFSVSAYYLKQDNLINEVHENRRILYKNIGTLKAIGVEFMGKFQYKNYTLSANASYVDSKVDFFDGSGEFETGNIPAYSFYLGLNALYFEKLNVNARLNWVGERKAGTLTSVKANTETAFDVVSNLDVTFGYSDLLPGLTLQLKGMNVLDQQFSDPGSLSADGILRSNEIPQPKFMLFGKILYDF